MSSKNTQDKAEKMIFDPDDKTRVRTSKFGIYDYWEDISGSSPVLKIPLLSTIKPMIQAYHGWPSVKRMVTDIAGIEGCKPRIVLWLLLKLVLAFIPAINLWYTGQLLSMVEAAVETRTVDKEALFRTAGARVLVPLTSRTLQDLAHSVHDQLFKKINHYYTIQSFRTLSTMDIPTFRDVGDTELFWRIRHDVHGWADVTWNIFEEIIEIFTTIINLLSTLAVLVNVFRGHSEATFFLVSNLARLAIDYFGSTALMRRPMSSHGIYAYRTTDEDYVHSQGLKKMGESRQYRKDLVTGGIGDAICEEYQQCLSSLGDKNTVPWGLFMRSPNPWLTKLADYMRDPVEALGQVYTCLKVAQSSSSIPFSLVTLQLINGTMGSLNLDLQKAGQQIEQVAANVDQVRFCYQLLDCKNKIPDGTVPFPENQVEIALGVSVEFRDVSFSYTDDKENLALKNVSFKVEKGQLCVIVGENGSGKSTILSLINRIYEVTEGEILIDEHNIRTLRLADLRKAIAVLDQSYSIFPVTLGKNIGYGDPKHLRDLDKIQQAAKLGGADEFIAALPYKYDTFTDRPVYDMCHDKPSSTSEFMGKEIDFSKLKLNAEVQLDLSGGQKQRIALSRTFMKSIVSSDSAVGLLLFDEPSASLDPKAEHDLFSRLRELRGHKTMVFSSHRFGKLTRHADVILYVDKGRVIEAGNHVELMKKDGEYAKFWNLQAQDFL